MKNPQFNFLLSTRYARNQLNQSTGLDKKSKNDEIMEDTKSILSLLSRGRTNSQKVRHHKRNSMNMTEVKELEDKIG